MMNLLLTRHITLFIFLFFFTCFQSNAANVCRADSFVGLEKYKERANLILPENTSKQDQSAVYIEYLPDGSLYYNSNYITQGFENPTKIHGNPNEDAVFSDINTIIQNIFYSEKPSEIDRDIAIKNLHDNTKIILDSTMFDENGIPRIDLTDVKNITVFDSANKTIEGETLNTMNPPPSVIAKIKGCCFYGRPPQSVNYYSEILFKKKLETSDIKIASLFIDSATESAFVKNKEIKSKRLEGDSKYIKSKSDFEKLFEKSKGKTLILIGHIEKSDYVIRDSANKETFRIPIEDVRQLARRESVTLIDIGCETTKAIETESIGIGISTKYNSVDAVNRINNAIKESKNYEDFLGNLASKELKVVVDESFIKDQVQTIHTTSYARLKNSIKDVWIKISQVTFSFKVSEDK
ncbi:MAG: hypothetical protein LBE93_18555 [Enterobacter asburiae]|jgi:hypothetical protein|nr:hypothetical protein [Enterobacter asburiae]